ncbi:MAG: hypothetical protein AAF682_01755 [Planctomycetota bacterium]
MGIRHAALLSPLVALPLAAPVAAGELDLSLVDAKAEVVFHADVELLVQTKLFGLLSQAPELGMADALAEFEEEIGLNPLEDVHSMTAYGLDADDEEDWVALIHTSDRLDAALDRLKSEEGYRQVEMGGRSVHSLKDGGETWFGYVFNSGDRSERLFLLSEDSGSLLRGVDVVEGSRPSVDEADEPSITSRPSPGSILFVSVGAGLSQLAEFDPAAEVSKLISGFTLDAGEDEEMLFARVVLETPQHEDALKVYQVIQGGIALLGLIAGADEELAPLTELANALDIQRKGTLVTLQLRYPTAALLAMIEAVDED